MKRIVALLVGLGTQMVHAVPGEYVPPPFSHKLEPAELQLLQAARAKNGAPPAKLAVVQYVESGVYGKTVDAASHVSYWLSSRGHWELVSSQPIDRKHIAAYGLTAGVLQDLAKKQFLLVEEASKSTERWKLLPRTGTGPSLRKLIPRRR